MRVSKKQSHFLKGLISLWWTTPHTDISYNDSVQIVKNIIKTGAYVLGGKDEAAIKHLMQWYMKYNN